MSQTTEAKLQEAKAKALKLIACDFDGTLYKKPEYTEVQAQDLLLEIAQTNVVPAVITAREASIRMKVVTPLSERLPAGKVAFVASSNGGNLWQVEKGKVENLYRHDFTQVEIDKVAEVYGSLNVKLDAEMDAYFEKNITKDWDGYIEDQYLEFSRAQRGVWTESSKVTLYFGGSEEEVRARQQQLKEALGPGYAFGWAGWKLIDVTKSLRIDGKLYAVKKLQEILEITEEQIATFGDKPDGNDVGLLTLPYSFTNNFGFQKIPGQEVPYILPYSEDSVGAIYEAVGALIKGRM